MPADDALAARLAAMFGRRSCVLTGNGTTAIYLALKAIEAQHGTGEVLVPAIACPSIPQVIQYAGFTPRYVDVNLGDFTADVASLASSITAKTRALLPVHIYGHACDMEAVSALARSHGLPVIEDAAQSIGGRHGDALLGATGDFGILSFGAGKIVDAGGGGALLFDDHAANANAAETIRRAARALPARPASPDVALETLSHWQLYHGTMNYLRVHPEAEVAAIWQRASPLFADLYLHAFPAELAPRIDDGLTDLAANLAARLRRAERYAAGLSGLRLSTSDAWRRSGTIWRYTFLAPSRQDANKISAALRSSGVDASNHYWSLADLFDGDKTLCAAQDAGSRVINLWVDDRATDDAINFACERLKMVLLG
jgi:dTDP-4-amino-4,6-dideoxygalactose transaminase